MKTKTQSKPEHAGYLPKHPVTRVERSLAFQLISHVVAGTCTHLHTYTHFQAFPALAFSIFSSVPHLFVVGAMLGKNGAEAGTKDTDSTSALIAPGCACVSVCVRIRGRFDKTVGLCMHGVLLVCQSPTPPPLRLLTALPTQLNCHCHLNVF